MRVAGDCSQRSELRIEQLVSARGICKSGEKKRGWGNDKPETAADQAAHEPRQCQQDCSEAGKRQIDAWERRKSEGEREKPEVQRDKGRHSQKP